ncbi:hypothetical protein BDY19DRAFT_367673 [Irpex rosettiformis]|uniref:Uncharacterized protein n=1 Tax=Irpex rosettiformis TaxID=378272 RepID=A0ACB8TWB0_9APHY|nr:hypothetical protein BDY19DRAFT_367673 [Irpex rosettiformis]
MPLLHHLRFLFFTYTLSTPCFYSYVTIRVSLVSPSEGFRARDLHTVCTYARYPHSHSPSRTTSILCSQRHSTTLYTPMRHLPLFSPPLSPSPDRSIHPPSQSDSLTSNSSRLRAILVLAFPLLSPLRRLCSSLVSLAVCSRSCRFIALVSFFSIRTSTIECDSFLLYFLDFASFYRSSACLSINTLHTALGIWMSIPYQKYLA